MVQTLRDSLWVISNEIEVPAIAIEETMILKSGHRIAILIEFYIVSCAMKAKKSAKRCTTHSEFNLLLLYLLVSQHRLGCWSSIVAFCAQQFECLTISLRTYDLMENVERKNIPRYPQIEALFSY